MFYQAARADRTGATGVGVLMAKMKWRAKATAQTVIVALVEIFCPGRWHRAAIDATAH